MDIEEIKILSQTKPLIIKFQADWCEPCKWFEPFWQEVKNQNEDKYLFLSIDVDIFSHTSEAFQVRSVPTLLIFNKEIELARFNGMMYTKEFMDWINSSLEISAD